MSRRGAKRNQALHLKGLDRIMREKDWTFKELIKNTLGLNEYPAKYHLLTRWLTYRGVPVVKCPHCQKYFAKENTEGKILFDIANSLGVKIEDLL